MFVVEVWNYHKNLHAVLVLMVDEICFCLFYFPFSISVIIGG